MVCLAFAYVICFPPRFRFNISGINIRNMDVQAYIWNHKWDKCVNITQSSLLLLFKLLCVDHCITEGLRSLTSPPPPNWCYSEVHGPEKQTFVMFGMKILWETPSCLCRWRGRWITKMRCGSSPLFWTRNKRIVSFHAPSDGPACCARPGLRAGSDQTWTRVRNVGM